MSTARAANADFPDGVDFINEKDGWRIAACTKAGSAWMAPMCLTYNSTYQTFKYLATGRPRRDRHAWLL